MAHPKQAITRKDWLLLSLFFLIIISEATWLLSQLPHATDPPSGALSKGVDLR
jgi:hypothetical protein